MLDRIIASGGFIPATVVPVVDLLCAVYRSTRVDLAALEYQRRLSSIIDDNERELCGNRVEFSVDEVVEICARQRRFLSRAQTLTDRVRRIVEGHGDLRPDVRRALAQASVSAMVVSSVRNFMPFLTARALLTSCDPASSPSVGAQMGR